MSHARFRVPSQNAFKPWDLVAYVAQPEKHLAEAFETYLKSGTGRAFAKRQLMTHTF